MRVRLPAYPLVLIADPLRSFPFMALMSSGEIKKLCKWTVVRINGAYFVLGELAYLASCETGPGLLAAVPGLCHKPHRPWILYGYVDSCYEAYHITRDGGNDGLMLAWRLQNSN